MSFAVARNESEDLCKELVRIEGQNNDTEAMAASLAIDVANHRATQQRLEIVQLQNEAASKCLCCVALFCSFGRSLNEVNLVSFSSRELLASEDGVGFIEDEGGARVPCIWLRQPLPRSGARAG